MIDRSRLAAYLDEAGDEPASSCSNLNGFGIRFVCLRQLWTGNVLDASDDAIRRVKDRLDQHKLQTAMICTNIGSLVTADLPLINRERLDRLFLLAGYFSAPLVRVCIGLSPVNPKLVNDWLNETHERALLANITPVFEPTYEHASYGVDGVVELLNNFPRFRLIYDPAQLVLQKYVDPFEHYWTKWKNKIAAIDLHDVKFGHSFRPPGQGDCNLAKTIRESNVSKYNGWYFIESGLGKRYGDAFCREHTFVLAMKAFKSLEEEVDNVG